jgi:hypothetical protein
MWKAKHISMDTGAGFDGQFLVGAGVEPTISYLRENGHNEIAEYIDHLKGSGDLDDLEGWEKFRIHYFYPPLKSNG